VEEETEPAIEYFLSDRLDAVARSGEAETEAEAEEEEETEAETNAKAETETEVEAEAEVEVEAETEAETETVVEAEAEAEVEIKTEAETETGVEAKAGLVGVGDHRLAAAIGLATTAVTCQLAETSAVLRKLEHQGRGDLALSWVLQIELLGQKNEHRERGTEKHRGTEQRCESATGTADSYVLVTSSRNRYEESSPFASCTVL
jgi:archaellum component FlaD/FlaE